MGSFPGDKGELDKLGQLWQTRSQDKAFSDYPVGPGDIVEISVPAIEELRVRDVRIAGDGTLSLPFIGKIKAAGLTEEELKEKVIEQLREYMYNPRVVVFVKEYHSRQVAVLGAVLKPGVYSLTVGADTLLDMISQAGGIAPGADPKLYLIPAEPVESGRGKEVVSALPVALLQQDPAPLILKRTDPILIDIKQLAFGGNQHYLSITVRPGDVIMVPGGGQVLVEGWVERPGAYSISPGLTVAGVVGAAGGPLFPADVHGVKVIRADKQGTKTFIVADLDKIKRGASPDVALQGGDIVEVSAETSKLIPYGLYRFFSTIVNVGVGGSIPITK
jgi:polysaccharide export outer membrane protein